MQSLQSCVGIIIDFPSRTIEQKWILSYKTQPALRFHGSGRLRSGSYSGGMSFDLTYCGMEIQRRSNGLSLYLPFIIELIP
jgi:hypothetical protein